MCVEGVIVTRARHLLEGAALVRTEGARHGLARRVQAAAAEPLALRDVRHSVALLVAKDGKNVVKCCV